MATPRQRWAKRLGCAWPRIIAVRRP
jgi:hypothetical protein